MTPWNERSQEERALMNPAFCSLLLWWAARGYGAVNREGLSFQESFLVLPLVLPGKVRRLLPTDARTSLAVWIRRNPLVPGIVANTAKVLVPVTRESLMWGARHGLVTMEGGNLHAVSSWQAGISRSADQGSDETRSCQKRAEFVGRWFARTRGPSTVLALLGVRP